MQPSITRRGVLRGAAGLALVHSVGGVRLSLAAPAPSGEARLVFVFLRGGLDGLSAVPAYGDPQFGSARGELALPPPGESGGVLRLDDTFALHPELRTFHELFERDELLVLHAVASPYRARSHFDAQDLVENGASRPHVLRDGWLNRALADRPLGALGIGSSVPLSLRGEAPAGSWAPSILPVPPDGWIGQVEGLYAQDPPLADALHQARELEGVLRRAGLVGPAGRRGAAGRFPALARAAGIFLRERQGPRVAMLETTGWDTHAQQALPRGALGRNLRQLDRGIGALAEALGPAWRDTAVLIVTEFGRTVAMNGSRGTDHGTASAAFLLGGAVRGGRVVADWPGLAPGALYEGRDLRPTLDLRSIQKGVLRDHLRVSESALAARVFPDSSAATPLDGLIRELASVQI